MSTNFPTSLDALTNPVGTDAVATVDHAAQHANANDSVEALEAKVGADSSAVTTSHDYKLSSVATGQKTVSTSGDQTITGTKTFSSAPVVPAAIKPSAANTLTLPDATDTVATLLGTQTIQNKTLSNLTVDLAIAEGGTAASTATAAFNNLAPTTTQGDTIYHNGTNNVRLVKGTAGQALVMNAGATAPEWQSAAGGDSGFGGTGNDGALAIASGTTTIDLGGARTFVKNYTTFSITGTGKLAFSNAHASGTLVILKCQGDVTITSSTNPAIDVKGLGAAGGAAGVPDAGAGTAGTDAGTWLGTSGRKGAGGAGSGTGTGGAGGAAQTAPTLASDYVTSSWKPVTFGAGGGGGGAGSNANAGGAGGAGGGALVLQCQGALNFTSTVSAAGNAGSDAAAGTPNQGAGGGGGGGGGTFYILYQGTLTAGSGTITVTGGAGGAGRAGGSGTGAGGGGGGGTAAAGTVGATGGGTGNGGAGGAGGAGLSALLAV